VELKHKTWRNLRHLLGSGVRFGLMTDHPVSRQKMLLLQLRWFLRSGCDKNSSLGIITAGNAGLLNIDGFLGSLEKGKWASFVCWNGDPFDLTRYPVAVYGEGRLLHSS
jgi:imidazolonepropionase-like amidohydrolase